MKDREDLRIGIIVPLQQFVAQDLLIIETVPGKFLHLFHRDPLIVQLRDDAGGDLIRYRMDHFLFKNILDEKERPIGIQILGPHAGELLNEWVAVLNGNVKLSTLASAVHPYPTIGEINKKVAGTFISRKIFSETVRKSLTFFFNLKGRACGEDVGSQ